MDSLRKKTKHQKVRTGCITCKERRVKCGEERPNCRRCVGSGRKCDGYDIPKTWVFLSRKERDRIAGDMSLKRAPSWSCALLPDDPDRRSFEFYVDQTAPILSAYFGHSFWSKTLPQVSFYEPMIKYMILATSSLIESSELRLSLLEDNLVYQANHKQAIRRMISDKAPNVEYVLMACLLLACCEFMLGDFQTGMQHISSGIHILDEWYRSKYLKNNITVTEANLILTELAPLFASIAQKAPTYGLGLGLHPGMMLKLSPSRELPHVAKVFSNIHQARHTLDGIGHYVVKLMDLQGDVLDNGPLVPQLRNSLLCYSTALSSFEAQLHWLKRDRLAVWLSLLRAHHRVLTIVVGVYPLIHGNLTSYEPLLSDFVFISDEYKKLLAGALRQNLSQPTSSCESDTLRHHFGFIPPLFFVATKCPNKEIRATAISQIRSLKVREKHWNSCIAAAVAESLQDCKHGPSPMADIVLPKCMCNEGLEWPLIEHLGEVSGYQGATMTVSAECSCDVSP